MLEYFKDCFIVWLIGFMPMLGIYIAIPVGLFMELDPFSTMACAVFGTYLPIPLIVILFERLNRFEKIKRFLLRFYSSKFTARINKYGMWFLVLVSPVIGAWTVSITGVLLRMDSKKLLFYTLMGMILYAVVITVLIHFGLYIFYNEEGIMNLLGMR